jgi:DNA-binding winged helix-turn-helix (wHTH) protein
MYELYDILKKTLGLDSKVKINDTLYYDRQNGTLIKNNQEEISLTPQEWALLDILYNSKPNVIGYEALEYALGSDGYMSKEALRVAINALRKKIGKGSIKNHSKIGYSLCV